jgi:chromosome segregation ATPase
MIKEKGITATAKDIKNFNTGVDKKETFETYVKNIKNYSDIDFKKIIQLHKEKIKYITEINDTNVNNFHRDMEEKDKQISELKDLLSKKYGIMAKDKGVEGLLNQITELQVELQKHNDQYNKEIQGLKAEIEHEKETSCLAIMQVEEDKKKLKNKISLNKLEIERLNATLTLLRTDNEKLKKDLEEYY